jgi:hypothetical protein
VREQDAAGRFSVASIDSGLNRDHSGQKIDPAAAGRYPTAKVCCAIIFIVMLAVFYSVRLAMRRLLMG